MTRTHTDAETLELIRAAAVPLSGEPADWDRLLDAVGDARFVLLGEATHGTHEFYRARAEITQRLIREKGFSAVAVEADWPDAYRVNRFVRGEGGDTSPEEALSDFVRFPRWMWRNTEVVELVRWLRGYNDALPAGAPRVGFYGLDLYSLYGSIEAVLRYLEEVDPEAASRARERYSCFERFGEDPQSYGYATGLGMVDSCEDAAVRQLTELRQRAEEFTRSDGALSADEQFFAEQNARLVKNAEEYYRSMYRGRVNTWNLRDCHMADTLDALAAHLSSGDGPARIVVWEHNSHLGDARATYMSDIGEWNVGQLARERHGDAVRLVGFSTYTGTVTAAHDWDDPAQRRNVRPGMPGSYEALFHEVGIPDFLLPLRGNPALEEALAQERLERAIGVIYRPATERQSHYFEARLSEQFDAVIHYDETRALEPLDRNSGWERGEAPDTYPFGV